MFCVILNNLLASNWNHSPIQQKSTKMSSIMKHLKKSCLLYLEYNVTYIDQKFIHTGNMYLEE